MKPVRKVSNMLIEKRTQIACWVKTQRMFEIAKRTCHALVSSHSGGIDDLRPGYSLSEFQSNKRCLIH
jgi:hypothetical protein